MLGQSTAAEDTFPACNVHTFLFSHPFASRPSSAAGRGAKFPPTPPHKPIFFDPRNAAAITHSRLRRDTLRLACGVHRRFGAPAFTNAFGADSTAGPVVLLHLPNSIIWPVLALGFLAAGWTVTGTNPAYTVNELAHVVAQCEPTVIICHPSSGGEDLVRAACADAKHASAEIFLVDPEDDVYGAHTRTPLKNSWTSLLAQHELDVAPLSLDEANRRVAIIKWTSGTTGRSKGALISHRAAVSNLVQLWDGNPGYSADERWIAVAPFYHIFGFFNQLLLAPCLGATILVMQKFGLEEYLRLASALRATHLHIAPPIAVALAKSDLVRRPWCRLDSVKAATSGGAPLSPEVIQEVWNRVKIPIKMGYGLSETGGATVTSGDTWDEIKPQLGCAGRLFLGVQITVVDEDGKPLPVGTPGHIILKSPAQMLGYLRNPQATAEAIESRGILTGDIGFVDENRNIRIVDRMKELIKYKAFQVSPTELEAVISSLAAVQDVAVSSVYSDAQGTELPRAYVVPSAPALQQRLVAAAKKKGGAGSGPADALLAALAEQVKMVVEKNCVHYKRLHGGVTFIPAVPKSPSGKILRRKLKEVSGVHIDCYGAGKSRL